MRSGRTTAWQQRLFWRLPPPAGLTPRMAPPTPLMCLLWLGPCSSGSSGPASTEPLPQVKFSSLNPPHVSQGHMHVPGRMTMTGRLLLWMSLMMCMRYKATRKCCACVDMGWLPSYLVNKIRGMLDEPAANRSPQLLMSSTCAGQPGTLSPGPFQQFNCVVNTVVSLLGAAVAAFVASSAYHGKFDMVRLQDAPRGSLRHQHRYY